MRCRARRRPARRRALRPTLRLPPKRTPTLRPAPLAQSQAPSNLSPRRRISSVRCDSGPSSSPPAPCWPPGCCMASALRTKGGTNRPPPEEAAKGGGGGARKGRGGSAAAVGVAEARGISSNPGWQDSVLQGAARIGHNLERPLPSCQELDPRPTHAAPPTGQPASPACKPASVYQPAASQPRKQASSGGTRLPGRRPPCAAR